MRCQQSLLGTDILIWQWHAGLAELNGQDDQDRHVVLLLIKPVKQAGT